MRRKFSCKFKLIRENRLSLIQGGVSLTNHELKLLMVEIAK